MDPHDGALWEKCINARVKLTETLADFDDIIAEMIITDEKNLATIPSHLLKDAVRRVTLKQKGNLS